MSAEQSIDWADRAAILMTASLVQGDAGHPDATSAETAAVTLLAASLRELESLRLDGQNLRAELDRSGPRRRRSPSSKNVKQAREIAQRLLRRRGL